jgi:hypothetical protein
MLTIEIPKTNAKESAEDKLAKYILDGLNSSPDHFFRFEYYYSGCSMGEYGNLSYYKSEKEGKATVPVIKKVLAAFTDKGYLVNDYCSNSNIAFVKIQR